MSELSRGVFLGEQGALVQIYRAALYHRMEQLDDALNDLRQVLTNPDLSPRNREVAERRIGAYLFERDAGRVNAFVREKDFAQALDVIAAAESTAECKPAESDYRRLREWLEEKQAWSKIDELAQAERAPELLAAAQAFVQRFPQSRLKKDAQRMVDAIQRSAEVAGHANK